MCHIISRLEVQTTLLSFCQDIWQQRLAKSWGLGTDNKFQYIIDNNIEDNKIIASREIDEKYYKLTTREDEMDKLPVIVVYENSVGTPKEIINLFIDNLKKNKLVTFNGLGNDPLVIRANENTINKLTYNLKLLYLVEEERIDNTINITIKDDKVHFIYGLKGEYNALDDSITYDVENYSCKKEIEVTKYGDKINYTCVYAEREE